MKLYLFLEHRFRKTANGDIWSPFFTYDVWTRYLSAFESIVLCARASDISEPSADLGRVNGPGVSLFPLPYYRGPKQYLNSRSAFNDAVRTVTQKKAAYILRVPGNIAAIASRLLDRTGTPYGVEVIGDPWEIYSPGASSARFSWAFRRWFTWQTKRQCRRAKAILYVTESTLQRRYPAAAGIPSFHASNVYLSDAAYVKSARLAESFVNTPFAFICVAAFNQLYKGQDLLVEAFGGLIDQGLDAKLVFVGDGPFRSRVERLASEMKVSHRIEFVGQLKAGSAIWEQLDRSHLFILPSRQEGLPRAAIEAMARGLPVVGTRVGGFPELLHPDALVEPNDASALGACLLRLVQNPPRLAEMSEQNLRRAADFHREKLIERQSAFYRAVRDLSDQHCEASRS